MSFIDIDQSFYIQQRATLDSMDISIDNFCGIVSTINGSRRVNTRFLEGDLDPGC